MADIPVTAAAIDTFAAANLGTDLTIYEPETADTITIVNTTPSFYMFVNNLEASENVIITFTTPGTTSDLEVAVDDYVVTIAAGEHRQLGPFLPTSTFNTATNVIGTFTGSFTGGAGGNLQVILINK